MKSNVSLQTSIGFSNPAQKVWYAAHVLLSACTNSPAVLVRTAKTAVANKQAIIGKPAYPARPASLAIAAAQNTEGFAFGQLYLNSPEYPVGVPVPSIPARPATPAIVAASAVVGSPAISAISSPAVVAIKGYEDAITITQSVDSLTVTVELPVAAGVGIVGSNKLVIGEITPSTLQATAWLQEPASNTPNPETDLSPTLEQYLYNNALLCNHTITDIIRNVNGSSINCKRIVVTIVAGIGFDAASDDLQLNKIGVLSQAAYRASIIAADLAYANANYPNTSPENIEFFNFITEANQENDTRWFAQASAQSIRQDLISRGESANVFVVGTENFVTTNGVNFTYYAIQFDN